MKKPWVKILICAILIIGGFGNLKESPVLALVSVVVGVLILLWPLPLRLISGKGKTPAAGSASAPAAGAGAASASDGSIGTYQYDYSDVSLYRPSGAVGEMPPIGARLTFELDPENPYDKDAIKAVYNGETVGYMNKTKLREMIRDWINGGYLYAAEVTRNDDRLEFWIGMDRE